MLEVDLVPALDGNIGVRVPLVEFRRTWYNQGAADSFGGKEVATMRSAIDFLVSVMAGVIANYISKRWGGDRRL